MHMKYLRLLVIAMFAVQPGFAQRISVGLVGGLASYSGDLTSKIYPKHGSDAAIGISANYDLTDHITLRGGYTWAKLGAADSDSGDPSLLSRNLSFETNIHEVSITGQYNLFEPGSQILNPYLFAGLAVFRFNPYTYDSEDQKVYLQPLSTEGQGLSAYPDRNPYRLTQVAIPFGGGIKVNVCPGVDLGFELGMRKLFTAYLDDVSTNYVDWQVLYTERGPKAVELAFRGDELNHIPTNSLISYPGAGTQRGDPNTDYYYISGFHLTYKLGSSPNASSSGRYSSKKGKMGCPVNVY